MQLTPREETEFFNELDSTNLGYVNYEIFMSQIYVAKMYATET
jgi:hypothetical protein